MNAGIIAGQCLFCESFEVETNVPCLSHFKMSHHNFKDVSLLRSASLEFSRGEYFRIARVSWSKFARSISPECCNLGA